MTTEEILKARLSNEQLSQQEFNRPEDVVRYLGAVQSQDYPGAKWALGQRLLNITDDQVEQAFTEGKILRTHVLRPTWHFVHPEDIRWMLQLTGPRISRSMSTYNKKLKLDEAVFTKAHARILKLLEKEKILTRQEIKKELTRIGISTDVQRLAHIVMEAELRCLIVSGPRRGKNFSYMPFSDRVPHSKKLTSDEALAELVKRYFTSHGPAQIQDFVWWSGLTTLDAKRGIELNGSRLLSETVGEKTYYYAQNIPNVPKIPNDIFLLPNYDEYTIAYKDRSDYYDPSSGITIYSMGMIAYPHVILHKGKVIGTWRRTPKRQSLIVVPNFPKKPNSEIQKKLQKTIEKYQKYLGEEVTLHF